MKHAIAAGAALAISIASADSCADLYQWTDPATGVRQMSGTPPSWYRATEAGPRVRVFAHGRLVDDTAIPVSPEDAAALHARAFAANASAPHAPKPPKETAPVLPLQSRAATAPPPAANEAELKALIEDWDRGHEAKARAVLHEKPPADPDAPP